MSSPITTAGGLLELDPATLDRAITACDRLAADLLRARDGRIRTFPSASLRLGTLPSGQALATAYGSLWDGGEASLDGIVTSHIAIAEAMATTLASARDQLGGTDAEAAAALATLEALAKQGGTGAVLAKSLLPATEPASAGVVGTGLHGPLDSLVKDGGTGALLAKGLLGAAAAVFNLSPRSPGYHALPVAVTEPFAVMGHAEIAAAAAALAGDIEGLMNFADSWREAGIALTEAAGDAAAGLRVLPSGLSGELADRMIAAIEGHLVSLVTLGSVAGEIGGKLDTTAQGLSDAARSVPEIPVMGAADVVDPSGASQARLAAEQQAALELARDAMELRYRPVVHDAADRVPLLPPPDVPTSDNGIAPQGIGATASSGAGVGTGEPGHGGAGSGAPGSGQAAIAPGSSLAAGAGQGAADQANLGQLDQPTTLSAGTQPAGVATAGGEATNAPRPGTGAGPGTGSGAGPGGQPGAAGTGGPVGGPYGPGGALVGGSASGGASRSSTSGSGRPPSSSGGTARLPGGTLPPAAGAATTASSTAGTSSRPMMGGMAPMAPMAGGAAAGGQGHTPASYLTSKRNGRALIGDLPRTPRGIISGSDDIFDA